MAHEKKNAIRDSNHRPRASRDRNLPATSTPLYFLYTKTEIGMYLLVLIDVGDISTETRKQHPSAGDDASTAEAAPGRAGRDERG